MTTEEPTNPCCKAGEYDNWCTDVGIHVAHEGKTYCIFHAPMECQEKLEKWRNHRVYDRIDLDKIDGARCNLSGTVFPADIDFDQYGEDDPLPEINFKESAFYGMAHFKSSTFSGSADFRKATFSRETDFNSATFSSYVDFQGTIFLGDTYFHFVTFAGIACFGDSTFSSRVYFQSTTFFDTADFREATFRGYVNFIGVKFSRHAIFQNVTFTIAADFRHAIFTKPLVFSAKSNFFPDARFSFTKFEQRTVFRKIQFREGTFDCCLAGKTIIFDECDLSGLSLAGAPLEDFRFVSCKWPRSKGRNVIYDSRLAKYRKSEQDTPQQTGFFPLDKPADEMLEEPLPAANYIEDLFRRLKTISQKEHDDLAASDWHYGEKEMQLKRLKEESAWFLYCVTWVYKHISGYGEEPLRAFVVLLGLVGLPIGAALAGGVGSDNPLFPSGPLPYLPLFRIPADVEVAPGLWMMGWQILITVQVALLGFALRNKLRR